MADFQEPLPQRTTPTDQHGAAARLVQLDQHGAASRLVQLGATFEARDDMGWTPLHSAAYWGASHTVETLLEVRLSR
ncbi:hypothetical protein T484DRAFT_1773216 [Baffinella frigidus]|nr:hypothetical protein T484DRAFT_1773216 [Cryptophyta sp. CCMP2293]